MKTELLILEQLKAFLASNLSAHIETREDISIPEIDAGNIEIDYPDPDSMVESTMFYVVPENVNYSPVTYSSEEAQFEITIYILCKKEKRETLIKLIFAYFDALYSCIKSDPSLGAFVDNTNLISQVFYPAVEASKTKVEIS